MTVSPGHERVVIVVIAVLSYIVQQFRHFESELSDRPVGVEERERVSLTHTDDNTIKLDGGKDGII